MVENPTANAVYWCIRPSIESECHSNYTPRPPWKGFYEQSERFIAKLIYICDDDTLDYDSNCCSYVEKADLFLTKNEAWKAYFEKKILHIQSIINDDLNRELAELLEYWYNQ